MRLQYGLRFVLACAFVAAAPNIAVATPIYIQTPVISAAGSSDAAGGFVSADDFVVSFDAVVGTVRWKGQYMAADTPPALDAFQIAFYSDNAGVVGSLLQSFAVGDDVSRALDGAMVNNRNLYSYQADLLGGFSISGNTHYWISIFNDTSLDLDDDWYWALEFNNGGNVMARPAAGTTWTLAVPSVHPAAYFVLDGELSTVPEPGTLLLVATGASIICRRARARRGSRGR